MRPPHSAASSLPVLGPYDRTPDPRDPPLIAEHRAQGLIPPPRPLAHDPSTRDARYTQLAADLDRWAQEEAEPDFDPSMIPTVRLR